MATALFAHPSPPFRLYHQFHACTDVDPPLGSMYMTSPSEMTISMDQFTNLPELRSSPLKHRIASVFSNDQGMVSFEDYLDFRSAFSERGSKALKSMYAFRIYGKKFASSRLQTAVLFPVIASAWSTDLHDPIFFICHQTMMGMDI
jgi:hypothetical protein